MDLPCSDWEVSCSLDAMLIVFSTLRTVTFALLLALFYFYLWLDLREYRRLPYSDHRCGRLAWPGLALQNTATAT